MHHEIYHSFLNVCFKMALFIFVAVALEKNARGILIHCKAHFCIF